MRSGVQGAWTPALRPSDVTGWNEPSVKSQPVDWRRCIVKRVRIIQRTSRSIVASTIDRYSSCLYQLNVPTTTSQSTESDSFGKQQEAATTDQIRLENPANLRPDNSRVTPRQNSASAMKHSSFLATLIRILTSLIEFRTYSTCS